MGGGIRPRTVGHPAIGLYFDDRGGDPATGEGGAE
jgi:hypothetical protein